MFANRWVLFGAGVVVGVVGARFLLGHPLGRRATKGVVKRGFVVKDWMTAQVGLLREDISDVVAEARMEYDGVLGNGSPADAGATVKAT